MASIIFFLVACLILCVSTEKIIGGKEVQPHSMPYMAFLKYNIAGNTYDTCGGILIKEDLVLTAAHCQGVNMTVLLGAHNVKTAENFRQDLKVCNMFPYANDKKNVHQHDIMLLKLKRKAVLNRYVLPLPIVHRVGTVKPGTICNVAGWGKCNIYNDELSSVLREVDLKVVSQQTCSQSYKGKNVDIKEFICAGEPKEKKYSASGDSGGPLFCGKDLCGIVHGGLEKGKHPRLFTKVSPYIRWIKKMMSKANCKKQI